MSLVYWLSKFSQEAILLELFLIAGLCTAYFGYLLFQRRKYGVAKKNIPDHIVRAYLLELIANAEHFRSQLFGELNPNDLEKLKKGSLNLGSGLELNAAISPTGTAEAVTNSQSSADLSHLRNQLNMSLNKQEELNKIISSLTAEKNSLETKLKQAPAQAAAPTDGSNKELLDKIAKLESKLAEYEVIEDDLANLKKYQQENKQLKSQLEAAKNNPASPAAAPSPSPTQTPEPAKTETAQAPTESQAAPATPTAEPQPEAQPLADPTPTASANTLPTDSPSALAAAEETLNTTQAAESFEGFAGKVDESLAKAVESAPSAASVSDPVAQIQAQTAPAATDQAATENKKEEPPKQEKSDADLLNEFERMLSS